MSKAIPFLCCLFALAPAAAGCSTLLGAIGRNTESSAAATSGEPAHRLTVGGDYCDVPGIYGEDVRASRPFAENFRATMCLESPNGRFWERGLDEIPEAELGPELRALAIVTCASAGACDSENGRLSLGPTADMVRLSRELDANAVAQAIAQPGVPEEAQRAFMERLQASQAVLEHSVTTMTPPQRRVFLDPVLETAAAFRAAEQQLAPLHQELAALKPSLSPTSSVPGSLAQAADLRDRYVAACLAMSLPQKYCVSGPVSRPLTRSLVLMHSAAGDPSAAAAENAVFAHFPDFSELRYQLHDAVDEALERERELRREYRSAQGSGLDPATVTARFGEGEPMDVSNYTNVVGTEPPRFDLGREIPREGLANATGAVERVTPGPRGATIRFEEVVRERRVGVGCRETNRVERFRDDGSVVYRRTCRSHRTEVDRSQEPPVVVPSAEASAIQPGERLSALVSESSRRGHVMEVVTGDGRNAPVVQVGGVRLQ